VSPSESFKARPFEELTPDLILESVEKALGVRTTGSYSALNSVENRVLEIPIEDSESVVAKFYRPGRWKTDSILEEHAFLKSLETLEIPVISPLAGAGTELKNFSKTLFQTSNGLFYFSISPKVRGRIKDEYSKTDLAVLGRLIGRLHLAGEKQKVKHRPPLNPQTRGEESLDDLNDNSWLESPMGERYLQVADEFVQSIEILWKNVNPRLLTLHGDCHIGNLLWNEGAPTFLDFDDLCTGPAIQDLWMIVGDPTKENRDDWDVITEAYEEFRPFPHEELRLVKALRGLRMIHFSKWIAERWDDPSFPSLWPNFGSDSWWSDEIQALASLADSVFD
jgi:Ser/Thr protein kinase RdoA (MazF antagonist)